MDSSRADHLVLGYDLGTTTGDYTAVSAMRKHDDGTAELLGTLVFDEGGSAIKLVHDGQDEVSRTELLNLCLAAIKHYRPKTVHIRVGSGEPVMISKQTVADICEGRKDWSDLWVGPKE